MKQLRFTKAEELHAVIKTKGLDSRLVSLRLAKRKIDFIQHAGYLGTLAPVGGNSERMNGTFELMAGLADPKAVSFRSVNVPNYYLVHGNLRIRLQEFQDEEAFRQNATFNIAKGQGNKSALMFVSANVPTHCIHARERELWLSKIEATGKFSDRAEFEIVDAQFPFWGKRD